MEKNLSDIMVFFGKPELFFFVLCVRMIVLRVTWMMKSNRFSSVRDVLSTLLFPYILTVFYHPPNNFVFKFHEIFVFLVCSQIKRLPSKWLIELCEHSNIAAFLRWLLFLLCLFFLFFVYLKQVLNCFKFFISGSWFWSDIVYPPFGAFSTITFF